MPLVIERVSQLARMTLRGMSKNERESSISSTLSASLLSSRLLVQIAFGRECWPYGEVCAGGLNVQQ